ncbi:MAG: MATE family multidrug resistance protein [Gammaproteobacteria bacterium]|jgi:MATE family multidrug resistance protein
MQQSSDLTEISHRRVWALAAPIILANISVPLVGAVDTAVVGHVDQPAAIGAVALGALIFSFLYWSFGFLRMGTTGFIARALGANDQRAMLDTISRVILMAIVLGFVTIALSFPLIKFALWILESTETVEGLTSDYAGIRIWSAPAILLVYAFTGIFIGLQDTRSVFYLQLILNLTNMVLDAVFVIQFGWGVEGVAWASLIAEYLAMFAGVWLLRKYLWSAFKSLEWARLLERNAIRSLLTANGNIFIRTLCLIFAFAYFTGIGARYGETILAANAILLHFQSIMAYGLDGFAHAVEALAGSAFGSGDRSKFKKAVWITTLWSVLLSGAVCFVYWGAGGFLLGLFTDIESVKESAIEYMPWMIISPLVSVWSFQLDGIFIGVGFARQMRNAMLVSLGCYLLILYWTIDAWGNHGLFMALTCFMLIRALTLLFYFPQILKSIVPKSKKFV